MIIVCNLILLINIHRKFARMWVCKMVGPSDFVYICAKTSCVRTCLMFRLNIEYLCNRVIESASKLIKTRPEREPPKSRSSKFASALLRSLGKVLQFHMQIY